MENLDYKKVYKDLYVPKQQPMLLNVPTINYVAIDGQGDPNDAQGAYAQALQVLYCISYTIKMSEKKGHTIDGFFDYVVPPLEGLWEMKGIQGIDDSRKQDFIWTSMIRLPEFVNEEVFAWACAQAKATHPELALDKAYRKTYTEGSCVQCMHIGSYDEEPATIQLIHTFIEEQGYTPDLENRRHHEIYLSDPRKSKPEKNRCVIRIPVK